MSSSKVLKIPLPDGMSETEALCHLLDAAEAYRCELLARRDVPSLRNDAWAELNRFSPLHNQLLIEGRRDVFGA